MKEEEKNSNVENLKPKISLRNNREKVSTETLIEYISIVLNSIVYTIPKPQ